MDGDFSKTTKNQNTKSLIFVLLGWIILFIILITGVLASRLGFIKITIKNDNQAVVVKTDVCKFGFIKRYNDLLFEESADVYYVEFDDLASDIQKSLGYESDSSCVFMLANYYMVKNDIPNSQKFVEILKSNNSEGNYASGDIEDLTNIETVEWNLSLLVNQGMGQDRFKDSDAG